MLNRAKNFITVLLFYFWYPDFPVPTPGEDINKKAIVGVRGYPLALPSTTGYCLNVVRSVCVVLRLAKVFYLTVSKTLLL